MPVNPFDSPQKKKRGRPARQEVEVVQPEPEPVMPAEPVDIPSFLQTTEPRFPPPAPPEPPPVPPSQRGDPKERVIGKAADTFTVDEVEYAKAQLKQFARDTDGDPRALAIIYSAIYTDILVQRIDVEIERLERTRPVDPYVNKKIDPLYKRRSTLWNDYCSNLEKLGAMPKDRKKDKLGDDVLSAVYAKYLEELNRRRANKWPIGQPSAAAFKLAAQVGDHGPAKVSVRPEILKLDVLPDAQRKDFVETTDEPARPEGTSAEPDA